MTRFLLFVCVYSFSVIQISAQEETFSILAVDSAPVIAECPESKDTKECFNESLRIHIVNTIDIMKTLHSSGKAYVLFEISENGTVENVKVRSENKKHRKEAKRVIEALKVKKPATLNGKNVAVLHSVPVSFETKNFDSYSDFLASEEIQEMNTNKGVIPFEEVKTPPVYAECLSSSPKSEKECFQVTTTNKLKIFLGNHDLLPKKGQKIKYYFEVDRTGQLLNITVNGPGRTANRKISAFLESLKFVEPARDQNGEPAKTSFYTELVL